MSSPQPMESSFPFISWKPSIHQGVSRFSKPSKKVFERDLLPKLQASVSKLANLPYDPSLWKDRAEVLLGLGYPELAASDAWKALLLFDAGIEREEIWTERGERVWLVFGMGVWGREGNKSWWNFGVGKEKAQARVLRGLVDGRLKTYDILLESLNHLRALTDMKNVCKLALKSYPRNKDLLEWQDDSEDGYREMEEALTADRGTGPKVSTMLQMGAMLQVQYPWIPTKFANRSPAVIEEANRDMSKSSHDALEIKNSTLSIRGSTQSSYGIFAKRNIKSGEKILDSRGPFAVSSQEMRGQCYNCHLPLPTRSVNFTCCPKLKFCSTECRHAADKYYHKTLCGKDFEYLYIAMRRSCFKTSDAPAFVALVWLRLLAVCVQMGGHPLENPFFARLAPQYAITKPQGWSLEGNVKAPINILEALGIDIFSNLDYDQWVLENMWHRKKNNTAGGGGDVVTFAMDSMYSFFNHSCEFPPMIRSNEDGSSRQVWYSARDIKKGDEVCTAYVMRMAPKAIRQQQLEPWLAGPCGCKRCLSEK